MRLMVIHQNFPGQFRHILQAWANRSGWEILGLGRETAPGLPNIRWFKYKLHREVGTTQHQYLRQMESAVLHGQAVARALQQIKKKGYAPDVILAHPGWGETLYVRDVFPNARLIHFCEWYYGTDRSDIDFDPEFPTSFDGLARMRTWNALHALNLEHCDVAITPTAWQRSRHPSIFQSKIELIHEGIDTDLLQPDPTVRMTMPNGQVLQAGDPVVTYVGRNLEPYRGFHSFMRALERIQKDHANCHAVIVGGDGVSYGQHPINASNWRERMLREVSLDPARTHFLGKVPYNTYRKVLQISAAHVYLTYPFVLSWSMLEAMSTGCLIIGSNTAPVSEVIRDGENGLLVDFFTLGDIADCILRALTAGDSMRRLRDQARKDIGEFYSLVQGERRYGELINKCDDWSRIRGEAIVG